MSCNIREIENAKMPHPTSIFGWFVVLRKNVELAIFQPYLDLEAGVNQSLKIQVIPNKITDIATSYST